jgi:miniconductance mechanosensitive channel
MLNSLEQIIADWLQSLSFFSHGANSNYFANWLMFICWFAVAYLLFYGIYRLVVFFVKKIVEKTGKNFQKALLEKKFFKRLSYVPILIVTNVLLKLLFNEYPKTGDALSMALGICSILVVCGILISILNALDDSYSKIQYDRKSSIKGIVQAAKTVIYIIAAIFIICLLANVAIEKLLAGLAGASAITMLIFKDSILGFVAGIQLAINKIVLPGDWIEMPSADADGNVIEISLISVKVQNWDNTITTIPAYDLISKPVKNWRGMSASGVRRIKRSVFIDMTSVQFCTKEMLDKYRKIQYLDEYISRKETEIEDHNASLAFDTDIEANGRHLTNVGVFRAYLQRYLEHHPMLSHEFTLMARQLQPTNLGLPIEIYAFAKTIKWVEYEKVQSDIFDYILASINYFDLRLFQTPSWNDYRKRH